MADDTLTAALEEIRAGLAHLKAVAAAIPGNASTFDLEVLMPRYARAVAAVLAVLKMADEIEQRACNCGGSSCAPQGAALTSCAAKIREAITRELTGQEASDGS